MSNGLRPGDELLLPLPLGAMAVFALNNFVLKTAWPGWITGKLSDVAFCLFAPFLISALVGVVRPEMPIKRRVGVGAVVSATALALVKTSAVASGWLDASLAVLLPAYLEVANTTDPSDLLALPFCFLAVFYARRIGGTSAMPSHADERLKALRTLNDITG